jgi:uncharacterized protein YkwD
VAKLPIQKTLFCRPTALILASVLLAAALAATSASAGGRSGWNATASGSARVTGLPQLEADVLVQINALRRSHGLVPLRASAALGAAARVQSLSMAQHGFFAHESFGGSPFWKRVETRYRKPPNGWWSVGENLVWRSPALSANTALQLWLQSPPHRENLLRPAWREIGLAAVHASAAPGVFEGLDVTILTADFGYRR